MARIQSWHDFDQKKGRHIMDQLERGQGESKRKADGEQEIMGHKKTLLESGLLERIEKRRLELKKDTAHNFDLYPRHTYKGSMDSDHFLKELSFLHTQYTVDLLAGILLFVLK